MAAIKKLKAATVLESLVAATILVILFGLLTTFFVQIGKDNTRLRFRADLAITMYSFRTENEQDFQEGEYIDKDFIIRRFPLDQMNKSLMKMKFIAMDNEYRIIIQEEKVIPIR